MGGDSGINRITVGQHIAELGVDVAEVVVRQPTYAVFMDRKGFPWWYTDDATYQADEASAAKFATIQTRGEVMRVVSGADLLDAKAQHHVSALVAEAYSLGLQGQHDAALKTLDTAESFTMKRRSEVARRWYLTAGLVGVAFASLGLLVAYALATDWPYEAFVSRVVMLGAIGACFSLIARLTTIDVDNAAGRELHTLEALARMVAGAVAAYVVLLAVRSGAFAPQLGSTQDVMLLLGFVSGSSERFVPNLIKSLDGAAGGAADVAKADLDGARPKRDRTAR